MEAKAGQRTKGTDISKRIFQLSRKMVTNPARATTIIAAHRSRSAEKRLAIQIIWSN